MRQQLLEMFGGWHDPIPRRDPGHAGGIIGTQRYLRLLAEPWVESWIDCAGR